MNAPGDWRPTADWPALEKRAEFLRRLRQFFDDRGFLEVQTPLLSADTVVDRHLDPLAVTLCDDPRRPDSGRRLWLQTSPEFHMKRLLAAGGRALYQVTRAFRAAEHGRLHNPEFTIVEWYRAGDDMAAGMQLLSDLSEALLDLGPADRVSYADVFQRHLGLNPHTASIDELRAAAREHGLTLPDSLAASDRDGWLDLLLVSSVEPNLGASRPAIVYDYPASQAALARVRPDNPPLAERFELYVKGIELANGYYELLNPDELRERMAAANALRAADGKPRLPDENRLLAAMEAGLPASTGVALGFDRLLMLALGAPSLAAVCPFPIDNA